LAHRRLRLIWAQSSYLHSSTTATLEGEFSSGIGFRHYMHVEVL